MSEQEKTTAERIDSLLSRMSDRQQEVFLARGEGFVEGYKAGKQDAATVPRPTA